MDAVLIEDAEELVKSLLDDKDKIDKDLEREKCSIIDEHLSLIPTSKDYIGGLCLYVNVRQDHTYHIKQHKRLLDSDVNLPMKSRDYLKKHIEQHKLALREIDELNYTGADDDYYY